MAPLLAGVDAGNACSKFDEYISCLLKGCPASMKSQAEQMSKAMKQNPLFSSCGATKGKSGDKSDGDSADKSSCDIAAISKKGAECVQGMSKAIAGGMCSAFGNFECCFKDAFSSCDLSLQKTIAEAIRKQKQTLASQLASCGESPMCSTETEEALQVSITMDPAKFVLEDYIAAVKKVLGSSHVTAVVKYFKILVTYLVPAGATSDEIKEVLKKANNVTDGELEVNIATRRLGMGRRLMSPRRLAGTQAVATFKIAEKNRAVEVKASAGTKPELGAVIDVAQAPVTTIEVETKVRTSQQRVGDLTEAIKTAGGEIGATIQATKGTSEAGVGPGTSGSVGASLQAVGFVTMLSVFAAM